MMKTTIYFLLIFSSFFSCKEEKLDLAYDNKGILIKKKTLWNINMSDGSPSLNMMGAIIPNPLYNNRILLGGEIDNQAGIWSVNVNSGEPVWKKALPDVIDIHISYQFNDNVVALDKHGNMNNISLNDGSIKWKTNLMVEFRIWLSGIDSLFFATGYTIQASNPYLIKSAWVGNVNTGELHEFYFPDLGLIKPDSVAVNGAGGVERILPFRDKNNNILLVIYEVKYYGPPVESNFGLYNLTENKWIYKKIPMGNKSSVLLGIPEVFNNKLYHTTTYEVSCFDLATGQKLWGSGDNNFFSPHGHIIVDGKIIAMIDGSVKKLVCNDLNTGQRLWGIASEGTISTLNYLNGVVYFASMGDGRLHAVDANTGKYLWRIKPPDNSGLKDECAIVPGQNGEKGKVIVSTFLNGYCYEAER